MGAIHHHHSPSQLKRYHACPGWRKLAELAPPEPPSAFGEEGTLLHERAVTGNLAGLTAEQANLVDEARALLAELTGGAVAVRHEQRLELFKGLDILTTGIVDVIADRGRNVPALIVDWKFGRVATTHPADNLQLAAYAAMAMQDLGTDMVEAVVFQPRVWDAPRVMRHVFHGEAAIVATVQHVIARAEAPGMELHAGDHCRYCPALAICPEQRRQAVALGEVHSSEVNDPVHMARLLTLAKQVAKVCDSIEYHAKELARRSGGTLTGAPGEASYRLESKGGKRQIEDANAAFAAVQDVVTSADFLKLVAVSAAQLEDAYARARKAAEPALTLKAAKGELAMRLGPLVTRNADSESLVKLQP